MNNRHKLITFWGICDLASIGWFIGRGFLNKQIPFYHHIILANETSISFGSSLPLIVTYISLVLYASLIFSGFLLITHHKYGAILSYIQCPFRISTLIPPSLFFITWPVKYIFDLPSSSLEPTINNPAVILIASLILLCESLKLTTVIFWHKKYRNRITNHLT